MEKDPFKEYLKESEPDKVSKGYAWSTAIGLQAIDGLKPSRYLIDTAIQNIEGKITIKEAQDLIDSYYEERAAHLVEDERTEEADKVSSRIAELKELTVADMDFSIKDGQAEQKVNVTELIFKPTDAYLARYEQKYGKKSLFEGAKKVSIEIAYDRIAHIIVYAEEKLDSNLSVEIEQYKFEVVYLGPKFDVPVYNQKVKDDSTKKEFDWVDAV